MTDTPDDGTQRPAEETPAPPADHDVGRRAFFRAFSRQALVTVGQVAGMADAVTRGTTTAAVNLIGLGVGDPKRTAAIFNPGAAPAARPPAAPADEAPRFRSPYRLTNDSLYLLDQRALPDRIEEQVCRRGSDVAFYLRVSASRGGPLMAQLAAYGMALTAGEVADRAHRAREAEFRRVGRSIVVARTGSRMLRWAIERMTATWEAHGEDDPGQAVAGAMRAEAEAIASDAQLDHAAIARSLAALLPTPDGRPLHVLIHGDPGTLTCGHVGTVIGAIGLLASQGRAVRAWLTETRPYLEGARLAAWELQHAGVEHTVLPDSAVSYLLDHETIDAVLLGAEWIAANGDTANVVGSRAITEAAALAGWGSAPVPVYVCAPATTIDATMADGAAIPIELRPARDLATYQTGARNDRVNALNPATDVIRNGRITAIVTEEGVLRAPWDRSLAAAFASREARRPAPIHAPPPVTEPSPTAPVSPA